MQTQSRTYNNGKILEYIYTIIPPKGAAIVSKVFINVSTGQQVNPATMLLQLDYGSENKFKGTCCEILSDILSDVCDNAWITDVQVSWVTEDGLCWELP